VRFVAAFVTLSVAWVLLAPAYSAVLSRAVGLLSPVLETERPARYEVDGAKIVVVRSAVVGGRRAMVRQGLWDGRFAWSLTLLVAVLVAVPRWAAPRRWRSVVYAVAAMAALHLANVLTNVVYTQMRAPGVAEAAWSPVTQGLVSTSSYFLDVVGNGLAAMVLFFVLVDRFWRPAPGKVEVGRNDPCPCGSGRKAKHCCGVGAA